MLSRSISFVIDVFLICCELSIKRLSKKVTSMNDESSEILFDSNVVIDVKIFVEIEIKTIE